MKTCKNKDCQNTFNPVTRLQRDCFECVLSKAKIKTIKDKDKEWKVRKRALKDKTKKLSDYKAELQDEINKIARLIDHEQVCISCQKIPKKKNGCHFHSVGSTPALRFNLLNVYLGCEKCNSELGGNVHGYIDGLILTFGKEYYEFLKFELPQKYRILQISKDELIEKIKICRELVRNLETDLVKLESEDRIAIRHLINDRIGIYV